MRELFRFLLRQRDNLLFIGLMVVALTMLVNGNMHQRAQVISSSRTAIGNIYQWRSDVTEFASLRKVNRELAEALARERAKVVPTTDSAAAPRIDSTFGPGFRYTTAQVINSTSHKERNFLTLDRGSDAGVHADQGVMGPHGIVGVVRETSPRFALVVSVLNPDFSTSVKLARTGHYGLFKWDTHDPTTASMTDVAKHVPVQVGDTVVTRGGDGIFPAGLPVGRVVHVENDPSSNFHTILIKLDEDLTSSGYVHVIEDLHRPERDSLQAKTTAP